MQLLLTLLSRSPRKMKPIDTITAKEFIIIDLIVDGKSYREIGKIMNRSVGTIKNTMLAIFNKVGVDNREQLALWRVRTTEIAK